MFDHIALLFTVKSPHISYLGILAMYVTFYRDKSTGYNQTISMGNYRQFIHHFWILSVDCVTFGLTV